MTRDWSAADVAVELRRRVPGIGAKKLHKLLYYCQGHHLSMLGAPLFAESMSAWDMGPVVGSLWYLEKQGGPAARLGDSARQSWIRLATSSAGTAG